VIAVLDTNIIIDALACRKPFNQEAENIFEAAGDDQFQGAITSSTVTDIYYIIGKLFNGDHARHMLIHLFNLFTVISVTGKDCEEALALPIDDYEDALLAVCALETADCIITRDNEFLNASLDIPVLSPAAFLARL
jgi:predicted nucleic acid-binding protein